MAMAVWLLLRWNFLLLSWNVCCLPLGPRSWQPFSEDGLYYEGGPFVDYEDGPFVDYEDGLIVDYNKPWQPHDDSGIVYSPPYYNQEFTGSSWQPQDVGPARYSDSYLIYSEPTEAPYLEPTSPPSLPEPLDYPELPIYPELPAYPEPGALTQLEVNLEHGSSETEEQSSELPPWLYSEEGQYVSPVRPMPPSPLYPGNYAHNLIGQIPGTISHFSTEYEEGRDHQQDVRYERYNVPPYPPKIPTRPAHPPKIPTRPAHPLKVSSDPESRQKLLDDPDAFIPNWFEGARKLAPGILQP